MRVDWHGYQNFRICVEEHAGWGFKKLAPHIQLLGLHTVTDEPGIVNETSAQGLLGRTELRGVREWTARHRVVAMHHYPYSMGRRRLFDMNFHKPGPAMIRRRLRANGVTMVLCGHCHDLEVRRTGKVTISLSGKGCAEDGWYGYHLVELPRKGRVRVIERSFDNT
jgi:hypothetical protein